MDNLKRKQNVNEEEQRLEGVDSDTSSEDSSTSPNKKKLGLVSGKPNADGGSVKIER